MGIYSTQSYNADLKKDNNIIRDDVPLAVNCSGIAKVTRGISTNPGKRRDNYLIYMIQGELTADIGGSKYVIRKDELICIPPETVYSYYCSSADNVRYFWIHFTGSDALSVLSESGISHLTVYKAAPASENTELYEELFSEFRSRHAAFTYRTALILRNILMRLATQANEQGEQRGTLDTSIRFIHTHLNHDLSVKKLADMEFLSEGYYRSLFKQVTGVSPSEYITEQRIGRACQLLTETTMSIDRVSEGVGIHDRLYFQRFFKKHTGITPAQFREKTQR